MAALLTAEVNGVQEWSDQNITEPTETLLYLCMHGQKMISPRPRRVFLCLPFKAPAMTTPFFLRTVVGGHRQRRLLPPLQGGVSSVDLAFKCIKVGISAEQGSYINRPLVSRTKHLTKDGPRDAEPPC